MISDEEFRRRLLKPLDELRSIKLNNEMAKTPEVPKEPASGITLSSYVSNPTGKGSAYVANRSAIKNGLNMTFIKLLREHRKQFYCIPYTYENGDILFYVKVPSEFYDDNKISYDVLFKMTYDQRLDRKNRDMKIYSNSPSFIYTYCYVYNRANFIIEMLKSKLPTEALMQAPIVRNPIGSFGYEKSTYIAARYLLDGGCLSDSYINLYGKIMTPQLEAELLKKIADPELLVAVYQHAQYQKRKTHLKELTANEKAKRDARNKQYAEEQKRIIPKKGFIVHKSPRSRITARKAQKALANEKANKTAKKPLKPISHKK